MAALLLPVGVTHKNVLTQNILTANKNNMYNLATYTNNKVMQAAECGQNGSAVIHATQLRFTPFRTVPNEL